MATAVTSTAQSPASIDGHIYNDDLLLKDEYRTLAVKDFSKVAHVLDQPALRAAFQEQDDLALRAKRRSQAAGFWALVCGLLSLMIASGELAVGDALAPAWKHALAVAGVVLAVVAALIAGLGMVSGKQKADWLHRRLFTERLRQFHFQTFVWRLREIAASFSLPNPYAELWTQWFERFKYSYGEAKSSEKLSAILESTETPPIWLHEIDGHRHPSVPEKSEALTELFRAYRELRLKVQHGYATHMLRAMNSPGARGPSLWRRLMFPLTGVPLVRQQALLRGIWLVTFALLLILHVVALVFGLREPHEAASAGHGAAPLDATHWLHLLVMWSALVAIAAKTLSEGLGLSREIERYQEYRAVVADILARFDPAGDPKECVELMLEFERASFEEMRSFMRVHHESSFVI